MFQNATVALILAIVFVFYVKWSHNKGEVTDVMLRLCFLHFLL